MLDFDSRIYLIYLAVKYEGDYFKIVNALQLKEDVSKQEAEKVYKSLKCKVITFIDYDYPRKLKYAYRPPLVLFYYGDISLIDDDRRRLGVVGSRSFSEYGKMATETIVGGLAKQCVIVSGLAKGIDAIAHQTAIDNGGRTIAVLGSGIDICYPIENKQLYEEIKTNHLLISEYPNNITPDGRHFPARNRIIVALSEGILVPQINSYQSGTNISINFALEMNKPVLAIPHPINEEVPNVTNQLLFEGADLVEKVDDVLTFLKWR